MDDERINRDIAEATLRGQQMRAITDPELVAQADALVARVPDLVRRWFCGPDNGKGRQAGYIATEEELDAWNAGHN